MRHSAAMTGKALLAALALLLAHPAPAAGPEGRYRAVGEPDVASELILQPDGRFRYALAAGAWDERAEGRWTVKGTRLRLVTEPEPVSPVFSAGAGEKTDDKRLTLKVDWPDGSGIAGVDLAVGFDSGAPIEGYTQYYGWTMPTRETRVPRWVRFAVPMHGLVSQRFPVDTEKVNALTFILTPNDLGVVDFKDRTLSYEDGRIVMRGGEGSLTYERVED